MLPRYHMERIPMKTSKVLGIFAVGATAGLLFNFTTQYTDTSSKDKEQLETVVREVVKSEFDRQQAEMMKMVKSAARDAVKESIAFIDAGGIFQNMHEFGDKRIVLQQQFKDDQGELQRMGLEIGKIEQELANASNLMSKAAKEKKEEEMAKLRVSGELKARNLQERYGQIEQDLQMQLLKEIQVAATEIASKENRIAVLAGGLAYADPTINLSDKVLEQVNKKYDQKKKKDATGAKAEVKPALAATTNKAKPKAA